MINFLYNYIAFIIDLLKFIRLRKKLQDKRFKLSLSELMPIINEKTINTDFDRHYIYHTAWAARVLKKLNPAFHIDIGSSLYFVGITSAFIPIKFYDIRPPKLILSNVDVANGNLLRLPFKNNTVESISCMHTIEHIGLGRYGDKIDPHGDINAINELKRVVRKKGHLLFVVPIGKSKIIYNAHRIYSYEQIVSYFSDFKLKEFALINNNHKYGLIYNPPIKEVDKQEYGCGCFLFIKK